MYCGDIHFEYRAIFMEINFHLFVCLCVHCSVSAVHVFENGAEKCSIENVIIEIQPILFICTECVCVDIFALSVIDI